MNNYFCEIFTPVQRLCWCKFSQEPAISRKGDNRQWRVHEHRCTAAEKLIELIKNFDWFTSVEMTNSLRILQFNGLVILPSEIPDQKSFDCVHSAMITVISLAISFRLSIASFGSILCILQLVTVSDLSSCHLICFIKYSWKRMLMTETCIYT